MRAQLNCFFLQWNVAVLPWWVREFLILQDSQIVANNRSGHFRIYNFVNEATLGSYHWVGESIYVILCVLFNVLSAKDNFDGPFRSHNSNLSSRPGIITIST